MLLFNCFIFPSPHPNEISLYKWVRTHFESLDALFCIPFWMSDCTFSQHVLEYHWSGLLTARFGISLKWSTYSALLVVTWLVPHETAAVSARSVYTTQPCTVSRVLVWIFCFDELNFHQCESRMNWTTRVWCWTGQRYGEVRQQALSISLRHLPSNHCHNW